MDSIDTVTKVRWQDRKIKIPDGGAVAVAVLFISSMAVFGMASCHQNEVRDDPRTPEGVKVLKARCTERGLEVSVTVNDWGWNVVRCKDVDGAHYNPRDMSDSSN